MEGIKAAEEGLKTNLLTASNAFQQFSQHENKRVKGELQRVTSQLSQEFESCVENRLGTAQRELEARASASIMDAKESFLQLFQSSETNAKQQFDTLIASALVEMNALQETTRENLSKMEASSRRQQGKRVPKLKDIPSAIPGPASPVYLGTGVPCVP